MNKTKSTKKALLMSMLSMLICVAMLIGSTFAWFTDSVTSGRNKITAGNLDIELYHGGGTAAANKVTKETVLFATDAAGNPILWEPGVVVYDSFTIKNEGTLALKYRLALKDLIKNYVVEPTGDVTGRSLTDVIQVAVTTDPVGARTDVETLEFKSFDDFAAPTGNLPPKDESGSETSFSVVLYWKPNALEDDLYNLKNGRTASDFDGAEAKALMIEFGIDLTATQYTYESDSFDNQYDKNAWLGEVDTTWYDSASDFILDTPAELAGLAKLVNGGESFAGKTVTLGDNINLDGKPWTPIGTSSAAFEGTFNGDGHTVSGVNVEVANGEQYTGFFGYVGDADITDLTLADIHIKSDNRAAGLIGHITAPDAKNVTISDVTVSGEVEAIEYAAGILGDIRTASKDYVEGTTVTISGCTNNANLTATAKDYEGAKVVGIVGHVEGLNPTITNCTNNGNISVTTKGDAVVAGIAGYIMDSTATEISGCTNNGSITVNSDYTKKCNIGGIISTAHAGTFTISDVENHGAITVNVKRSYGEEEKGSYAAKAAVAGIVGSTSQNVTVTNAENTANVTVTDARDNSTVAVGGVFGYNDGATQTVINGTNTGELSGTGGQSRYVGQMVGYLAKASTLVLTGCSGVGDAALLGGEIGGANVTIN